MLRSEAPRQDADLLIVNTVGELFDLYGLSQAYAEKARFAPLALDRSKGATARYAGELLQMMSG